MGAEPDFEEAFDRLWPRCYRLARHMTGNREAAEDIAAEAMARLYARWRRVGNLEWKEAWVLRVTTNLAIDAHRRSTPRLGHERTFNEEDAIVVRIALVEALRALPERPILTWRMSMSFSFACLAVRANVAVGPGVPDR